MKIKNGDDVTDAESRLHAVYRLYRTEKGVENSSTLENTCSNQVCEMSTVQTPTQKEIVYVSACIQSI